MEYCACPYPVIVTNENSKDKHCERCGHWWSKEHGSFEPGTKVVPRLRAFRLGRNDPCPCGSRKKFKKCCLNLHQNGSASASSQTSSHTPADSTVQTAEGSTTLKKVAPLCFKP